MTCKWAALITCMTGEATRNFSTKALALRSWLRQMARCCRIDSTVCLGCWRVMRKYFCRGRAIDGKMACAASYGSIGTAGPSTFNQITSTQSHLILIDINDYSSFLLILDKRIGGTDYKFLIFYMMINNIDFHVCKIIEIKSNNIININ